MSKPIKSIFCWSGGKDSAYCLHHVIQEKSFAIEYLLTTFNGTVNRVSMHGVREELIDRQAQSIGIPLLKVKVTEGTNEEYEREMEKILMAVKAQGINTVIFGDIFLEDLRLYRESNLAKIGMIAAFPLWKTDTSFLIKDFLKHEFRTVTCCVNDAYLGESWVGREIDEAFIKELPAGVDPCGENGEYHTFCYDGPLFRRKLNITIGEKVYKPLEIKTSDPFQATITKGFWFCDILSLSFSIP